MKAIAYEQPETLRLVEQPHPTPGPFDLILKVEYCGICGTDILASKGLWGAKKGDILGHEFVGTIEAIGSKVQHQWTLGERVIALPFISCGWCPVCLKGRPFECQKRQIVSQDSPGAFAQYVRVGSRESIKVPEDISPQIAALVEPLAVGVHGLLRAQFKAGERIHVMGAGPIGLGVMMWADYLGAKSITFTEPQDHRAAMAVNLGATRLAPGSQSSFNCDLMIECVGKPTMIDQAIQSAPFGSRVLILGVCATPDTFIPAVALRKELTLYFADAYTQHDFERTLLAMGDPAFDPDPMITHVIGLEELPAYLASSIQSNKNIKTLVKPP